MGLEEMNRLYQYYLCFGVIKWVLLVIGLYIGDFFSMFVEVWQVCIMNVDFLVIGFGGNEFEYDGQEIYVYDVGLLYFSECVGGVFNV